MIYDDEREVNITSVIYEHEIHDKTIQRQTFLPSGILSDVRVKSNLAISQSFVLRHNPTHSHRNPLRHQAG